MSTSIAFIQSCTRGPNQKRSISKNSIKNSNQVNCSNRKCKRIYKYIITINTIIQTVCIYKYQLYMLYWQQTDKKYWVFLKEKKKTTPMHQRNKKVNVLRNDEEHYKTLLKLININLNKWRHIPCSWISTLLKLIYNFNSTFNP